MSTKNKTPANKALTDEQMKEQITQLMTIIEEHQSNMTKALESTKQYVRGDAAITHLEDLRKAFKSFSGARIAVEKAKRIVKLRLLERMKD
jgi:NurA-like 5'-3' nuclease